MFETYLAPRRPQRWRTFLIAGSIAVHLAAATGLFLYSIFHVEELAAPELTVTFFSAAPPPPPPPPPPTARPRTARATPKVAATALVEPTVKAPEPEAPAAEPGPADAPAEGGVAGGVEGGVAGGVVGGVVDAPPPPAKPKVVPSFVFDRERVSAPDPHLPADFLGQHPKQTLTGSYRICVGTDGQVTEMTPVRGILGADETIIQQVKETWKWKPQPLPVCTVRNFVFKIN